MNYEHLRLQTFDEWPPDTVVTPSRIAKAGFFSIKQDLVVECFACGVRTSDWNYGDQVMAKHRLLNPSCPFVLDPTTSGNVPKVNLPIDSDIDLNPQTLKTETGRLQTFADWPVPEIVSPVSLARAGFYSLRERDKTKCAYCGGVVGSWEQGDNPDREHQRHFPHCVFVQETINLRLSVETVDTNMATGSKNATLANYSLVTRDNLDELGIHTHSVPKRPIYATLEARLNTFASWPGNLIQTPDMLSRAGFYYEGRGDLVRCFHCDGGLRHWDPHDDPWTEHAKWFPKCSFIQRMKGPEFVTACAPEDDTNSTDVNHKLVSAPQRKETSEREIQNQMMTEAALAALEVGLQVGRIKQAIREKLQRTGTGFTSADALIEAALALQHDEDSEASADVELSDRLTRIMDVISEETEAEGGKGELKGGGKVEMVGAKQNFSSLEEENRLLKEARLCKICMDNEVGIVFLPCGHLATCVNCASNLQDCPVCRSAIKATVRTFLS